jgi:signal transduction histidine kinase
MTQINTSQFESLYDSNVDSIRKLNVKIVIAVVLAELAGEALSVFLWPELPLMLRIPLDSLILLMVIFPTLYVMSYRPLVRQMDERQQFEREMMQAVTEFSQRKIFVETVLANIQSGIIVTDLELRVSYANQYVAFFLDKPHSALTGTLLLDMVPEIHAQLIAGNDSGEVSLQGFPQDVTIGFKKFELLGRDGGITGHIITFIDLSEIIKVRKEIKSKERLVTMGEVVAKVAHEMRNPLFGITAAAQILGMELKLTPGQKELMNSLFTEARRLNNLVEELLDCSKEMRLKKTTADLARTINESISFNEVYLLEKGLNLNRLIPVGEKPFHADHERLKQVLVNIFRNAVDAAPKGGMVSVSLEDSGDGGVAIRIADSGPGIAEDAFDKIFDVFYTTKRSGSGLGLPISRKIVEAHGGELTATNLECGGACFTITLPCSGEVA